MKEAYLNPNPNVIKRISVIQKSRCTRVVGLTVKEGLTQEVIVIFEITQE